MCPGWGYPTSLWSTSSPGATAAPCPAPTQVLLGWEPRIGLCHGPSSVLPAQPWDGQGFAKAPLTPMCCPLAFSPSCRAEPVWPPSTPFTPSPSISPGPFLLHPQSTQQGLGWLKLTFCSMGGGEQGQHQGREEQPHPGCPGAQPSCDCVGWSTAEPQHPLFAQPALAGEDKQPKVRTRGKGQRRSPTQLPSQPTLSWVCLEGDRVAVSVSSCSPAPLQVGHCSESGEGQQSQETVLRSCHTHFITYLMV